MAEFPFLPLSVDAYFRKTRHLSTAQHGAYLLLLMEAWQRANTALPDDDQMLARLVCMTMEEWQANKPVIMAFWKMDQRSKCWTQKRLLEAKSYVTRNSEKQRSNAKSRWEKDKDTSHGNATTHAKPMPNTYQTDASQSQSQSTESSSLPPSQQSAPPAAADEFERVSKLIRAAPGVSQHPVFGIAPLNPLWGMIQQGWNLETEILPVVAALASKAKPGTIRSWKYFVDEIVAQRQGIPAPPPVEATLEDWESRMRFGRRNNAWPATWGPYPNQPGCMVPSNLVKPDDGKGWTEWKAAS
jgi:uncharacterized protein YdaU (DUF1376 family)